VPIGRRNTQEPEAFVCQELLEVLDRIFGTAAVELDFGQKESRRKTFAVRPSDVGRRREPFRRKPQSLALRAFVRVGSAAGILGPGPRRPAATRRWSPKVGPWTCPGPTVQRQLILTGGLRRLRQPVVVRRLVRGSCNLLTIARINRLFWQKTTSASGCATIKIAVPDRQVPSTGVVFLLGLSDGSVCSAVDWSRTWISLRVGQ